MKKLKLKGIFLNVELEEDIENGTQISLDEDVIVSGGTFTKGEENVGIISYKPLEKNIHEETINEYLYEKFNFNELQPTNRIMAGQFNLCSRKPTPEEEILIKDHFNKPIQELELKMELHSDLKETFFDLIVYDISESNKLVFSNGCNISTYDDGEKEVFFTVDKYNIRHGIVYDINTTETFIEFDENISDLTDLLK
jgi:hypothetical protein